MRAYIRVCVIAGLLLAATGVASGAAVAAPAPAVAAQPDDCARGTDDYGAELPCELAVDVLEPVCDAAEPTLRYAVRPVGSDRTTVTLTFVNPGGSDVVHADQPLSGSVPWPRADWARPSVEVSFAVNPTVSAVVAYPQPGAMCAAAPERSDVLSAGGERAEVLSATGSSAGPIALVAGGLLLAGTAAVLGVRRRRA